MGRKGDKLTEDATRSAEGLTSRLRSLGNISCRKMFGGYGIFADKLMFALVNSRGQIFLKADDSNRDRFLEATSSSHGKMPYYALPTAVLDDDESLSEWAQSSIDVARRLGKA